MAKGKFGKMVTLGAIVGAGAWVYKKYDTIKSMYHKVSIFKGERYEYDTFDGEAIAAMFSGVMIDLSDVEFEEDEVYLDIYSLCSGIKILIPKDVEVVLEGTNNASGIQVDQDEDTEKSKTLYINYNITASGIQVTDNIDDFDESCCCGDPECDEDTCECDDETCECNEETDDKSVEETVEEVIEETVEEVIEEAVIVEDLVEDVEMENDFSLESPEETVEEVTEEALETVSDFVEGPEEGFVDFKDETSEAVEEAPKLDEVVNNAASELDEAAKEVDEAIEKFVKEDDSFDAFEPIDDSEDDFFE